MRKKLIVICLAALAASLAAGCGNGDNNGPGGPGAISRADAKKALEAMHFENAPKLGPIAEKSQIAIMIRQWGELWDVMSEKIQNSYEEKFKQGQTGIDAQIERMQKSLEDTQNEASKKYTQEKIDKLKKTKAQLPNAHNGREFFILWMDVLMAVSTDAVKPPVEHTGGNVEQDMVVCSGEDFSPDGKTGWIMMKTKSHGEYKGYPFVNEGGQWKLAIDFGGLGSE